MMMIKLSKRLEAVAGFIERGARVADIGTDHGHIPVYLAQNGIASYIIASDIGDGPLRSARRTAIERNVADKIVFIAAPGLSGVEPGDVDTIVIAGMGGETIAGILRGAPWTKRPGIRLIIQPQTKTDELYAWLTGNGYFVGDASLVCDNGRLYVIMLAAASAALAGGVPDGGVLTILAQKRDPLFLDYIGELISKARRAAEGLALSGTAGDEYLRMTDRLRYLEMLKEEAGEWQR